MAVEQNTLEKIFERLGVALRPLSTAASTPEAAVDLVEALGWSLPTGVTDLGMAALDVEQLIDAIDDLASMTDAEREDEALVLSRIGALIRAITQLLDGVTTVMNGISSLGGVTTDFVNRTQIHQELWRRLVDFLIVDYLQRYEYTAFAVLQFVGLVELRPIDEDPPNFVTQHTRAIVHYERIGDLFAGNGDMLEQAYGWGTTDLEHERLFVNAATVLSVIAGGEASLGELPRATEEAIVGGLVPAADSDPMPAMPITIYQGIGVDDLRIGLSVIGLRESTGGTDGGLAAMPFVIGTADIEFALPFGDGESWFFVLEASLNLQGGIFVTVRPGVGIQADTGVFGGAGTPVATGRLGAGVRFGRRGGDPRTIAEFPGGSKIELESFTANAGVEFGEHSDVGGFFDIGLGGGRIEISLEGADGFIGSALSLDKLASTFDLRVIYSQLNGLRIEGGAGFEISLAVHVDLGPIALDALHIGLGINAGGLRLDTSVTGGLNLGPLVASVDRIGLRTNLELGGSSSPVDIGFAFKPPNGVGLSLDAGVVKGGGYLFFDTEREEYAGALELVFSEWIALKAIGLVTTRMPDGSKGFSLLIIITVEFGSGIQLGFGFTLLGVGGLLGLNRVVRIEPLSEGVRTGSIESVMFPEDVIANAPRIISDLRAFFPPKQNVFLIGPMAKIGWGTPTLVRVQLGVILEFPSVNITILGVIKVVLPDEDADVLRLQVNFIGRFEPANKLLWFYAELFDSRVLFITIEGGFGLLVNWGDNANFVVTAGGFHPRYEPPPLPFPDPPRLAITLLNESYARIRVEGYFAVTSNSVQFGARAELFFGVSAFNIDGHLQFDALFQFDPFFFSFSLSISLSVKVFGVGLFSVGFSGLLEGPTPWFIKGKGRISILFFKISVPFEHRWGQSQDTTLAEIPVLPLLVKELEAISNWTAELPSSSQLLVSLRQLGGDGDDELVLHPVGRLAVSQRKIPLEFTLDKVGNQQPSDFERFEVAASLGGGGSALSPATKREKFAVGQYKDLDAKEKTSAPGFEPMKSGLSFGLPNDGVQTSRAVRRVVRYETIVVDTHFKRRRRPFFTFFTTGYSVLHNFLFTHFLRGNSTAQSTLSAQSRSRVQPFDTVIQVQPHQYSVVSSADNRPFDTAATAFASHAEAVQFLAAQVGSDASLAGALHVVPNTEVNTAA